MWGVSRRRLPDHAGFVTDVGHSLQSRSACEEVHRTRLTEEGQQQQQQGRRPGTIVRGGDANDMNGCHLGRLGRELQWVAARVGGHAHFVRRQQRTSAFTAHQQVDLRKAAVGAELGSGWCSGSASSLCFGMSTPASTSDNAVPTRLLPKPTPLVKTDVVDVADQDCHQSTTDLRLAKWRQSQLHDSLAKEPCQKAHDEPTVNETRSLAASKSGNSNAVDPDCEGLLSCQHPCTGEDGCRGVHTQHYQAKQGAWECALAHEEPDVILLTASPWVRVQVLHASASQHNAGKQNPCSAQPPRACSAKLEHEAEVIPVHPCMHAQQKKAANGKKPMATSHATCARRWNSAELRLAVQAAGPPLCHGHQRGPRTQAFGLPRQTHPDVVTVPTPRRLVSVHNIEAVTEVPEVPEFPERLQFELQMAEADVARLRNGLSTRSSALHCKCCGESTKWLFPPASGIGSLFDELMSAAGTSSTESKCVAEQRPVVSEGGHSVPVTAAEACCESPPSFASERAFETRVEAMSRFSDLSLASTLGSLSTAMMADQLWQ